jgi:hypothetical protein
MKQVTVKLDSLPVATAQLVSSTSAAAKKRHKWASTFAVGLALHIGLHNFRPFRGGDSPAADANCASADPRNTKL